MIKYYCPNCELKRVSKKWASGICSCGTKLEVIKKVKKEKEEPGDSYYDNFVDGKGY